MDNLRMVWYFVIRGGFVFKLADLMLKFIFQIFISFFSAVFSIIGAIFSGIFSGLIAKKRNRAKQKSDKPSEKKKPEKTQSHKRPQTNSASLARIDKMEGHDFEQFTANLLRKLGYERVEVTPGSGDQGVDVIAVKGGKRYAIQCKRYGQKLGNKPVQEVFAGKTIYGCSVAVVLTNNYFTDGAKEAAKATGVELWDRDTLRRMLDYANFKALV